MNWVPITMVKQACGRWWRILPSDVEGSC